MAHLDSRFGRDRRRYTVSTWETEPDPEWHPPELPEVPDGLHLAVLVGRIAEVLDQLSHEGYRLGYGWRTDVFLSDPSDMAVELRLWAANVRAWTAQKDEPGDTT